MCAGEGGICPCQHQRSHVGEVCLLKLHAGPAPRRGAEGEWALRRLRARPLGQRCWFQGLHLGTVSFKFRAKREISLSGGKQSKAEQSRAKQSKAEQSRAKQSKAKGRARELDNCRCAQTHEILLARARRCAPPHTRWAGLGIMQLRVRRGTISARERSSGSRMRLFIATTSFD